MMLYGSVHETPDAHYPYLAVVTNEDGIVVATRPAASRREAENRINDAKHAILKKMIARRCSKRTH